MANEITISVVGGAAPTVVSKEALRAFYAERMIAVPGVVKHKIVTGQPGQNYDFYELGALTVGTIPAGGAETTVRTQWAHTQRQVALSDWRGVSIRVDKRSKFQSSFEYSKEFGVAGGGALGEDQDVQTLADYANFTSNVIGSSTATNPNTMSDEIIRGMLAKIENQKVRRKKENISLAIDPTSWYQLLADADFKTAYATGKSLGVQISGDVHPVYGLKVLVTPSVSATGSVIANQMFAERAIGYVLNKDMSIEFHDKLGDFSEAHLGWYLGGSAIIQQQAGGVMYTAL